MNFMRRSLARRSPIWFFNSAKRASTFLRARCDIAKAGVVANSRARCRAGSWMCTAIWR